MLGRQSADRCRRVTQYGRMPSTTCDGTDADGTMVLWVQGAFTGGFHGVMGVPLLIPADRYPGRPVPVPCRNRHRGRDRIMGTAIDIPSVAVMRGCQASESMTC